jgi:hypothetical protein
MKRLWLTVFATAVLALPLAAQKYVQVDIPFEFVVGNTTAPAGTYEFSLPRDPGGQVRMRMGSTADRFFQANPETTTGIPQVPKLVFHRYGNQYFLSRIGTMFSSRDLPPSRLEREARKAGVARGQQMQTGIVLATR